MRYIIATTSLLLTAILLGSSAFAGSWSSTFSGDEANGVGSADVMVSVVGNVLTMTVDNTSPPTLINGDPGNAPGITGFGFNLDSSQTPLGLVSWTLKAYDKDDKLVTIGAAPDVTDNLGDWVLRTQLADITMDYLPTTDNGHGNGVQIKGALYNPAADASALAAKPNYFTQATFVATFDGPPTLSTDGHDYFVRMQNVGKNGAGSLKLFGDGTFEVPPPVTSPSPEPTSLALFGIGLACCSGWSARLRRKPTKTS